MRTDRGGNKGILTQHSAEMGDYLKSMVGKFEKKYNTTVKPKHTPFLTEANIKKIKEEAAKKGTKAKYGDEAASPIMAGLYSARSCRPGLSVATCSSCHQMGRI